MDVGGSVVVVVVISVVVVVPIVVVVLLVVEGGVEVVDVDVLVDVGRVVVGPAGLVLVVVGREVVGPGAVVVGVGAEASVVVGVSPASAGVVVVGVGSGGNGPAPGTVVAGPNTMVVVVAPPRGATEPPEKVLVEADPAPAPESRSPSPSASTCGDAPGSRSSTQLAPANTTRTARHEMRRTIAPEMRRPMTTLLRMEKPVSSAPLAARRSAICLASSPGLGLCRPLGWGNEAPFLSRRPVTRKLRRPDTHVNDRKIETGAGTGPCLSPPDDPGGLDRSHSRRVPPTARR